MPLSPNPDSADPPSFETTYRELQQIVAHIEYRGLDHERAIVLFERGSQLVQLCERIVDQAELRVTRLAAESASPLADAAVES